MIANVPALTAPRGSLARRLVRGLYRNLPFKLPLFRALRQAPIPERVYRHLHFSGPFDLAIGSGRSLRWQSHGDVVENNLFWRGLAGHEAKSLEVWTRLAAASSGVALDIGANSGLFGCLAKARNPDLTVVAFEPLARVVRCLRRNVEANHLDIQVVEAAVSDRNGQATIHDCADPSSDGNAYSASLEQAFDFNTVAYPVETLAIDAWAARPDAPVSLVKLDVECHEPAAIAGMIETIRRDRPAMLVEVLTADIAAAIASQLDGLVYRYFTIDETQGLIERDRPIASHCDDRNILICTAAQFEAARLGDFVVATESLNP